MKQIAGPYTTSIHIMALLFLALLFIVSACKKDTDPTSPYDSHTLSVNGRWVGGGHHFVADMGGKVNFTLEADFKQASIQEWESNFVGTMSTTWNHPGYWVDGQTNQTYIKGTVSNSRKITIADTGGIALVGPNRTIVPIDRSLYSKRESCILSANGDTISYSGSSGYGPEVFVLVRQK